MLVGGPDRPSPVSPPDSLKASPSLQGLDQVSASREPAAGTRVDSKQWFSWSGLERDQATEVGSAEPDSPTPSAVSSSAQPASAAAA